MNIIIHRSGTMPLRFNGALLAESKGRRKGTGTNRTRQRWYDLAVYRTEGGKFVAHVAFRSDFGEPGRDEGAILDDAPAVVKMFADCDPLASVQGYPPEQRYAAKQERMLSELAARFEEQVSEVLASPEFAEVVA